MDLFSNASHSADSSLCSECKSLCFNDMISNLAPHFLLRPLGKIVENVPFCTAWISSAHYFKHLDSFFVSLISQEIISSLPNIINDKYGRKVLLYLLSPRDPAHTVREIIEVLQRGDGNAHR